MFIKFPIKFPNREEGQGLVEYALILVLVAVVVIAILLQVGPALGEAFGRVTAVLKQGGVITSSGSITEVSIAEFSKGGFGTPSSLKVAVTVSDATDVTVKVDGGQQSTQNCSGTCTFSFTGVPANGAAVANDSSGGQAVIAYWK